MQRRVQFREGFVILNASRPSMKSSNSLWKEKLAAKIPEGLAREVDAYETDIALRKQGKIDERVFAETRLRRGTYGQRYDNGRRHDGTQTQDLHFPSDPL